MLWTLARKEFMVNVLTLRFAVAALVCLGLMTVSGAILVRDYERRLKDFNQSLLPHRQALSSIYVLSQVEGWADRPPSPLSFLAVGGDRSAGSAVRVSHVRIPTETPVGGRRNPLMDIFRDMGPAQVVGVLVSLMVLLFAYDAVSGERERGTLPLTFANSVGRAEFLMAKYVGGMATVSVPVIAGLMAAVAVALLSPSVSIDGEGWLRIGLIGACSLAYVSLFLLLGLAISSRFGQSSASLIVVFLAWICLVVVIPDGSAYLARRLRRIESAQVVQVRRDALAVESWGKMRAYAQAHPWPRKFWDWDTIIGRSVDSGDLPFAYTCLFAPREVMLWYQGGTPLGVGLRVMSSEQGWGVYRDYMLQQQAQARLARSIARLSPAWIFGNITEVLAGTDPDAGNAFMDQARLYRQELWQYVQDRGGPSSLAYFTQMREGDLRSFGELKALLDAQGKGAIQALARPWTENLKPLEGVPQFRFRPEGWQECLGRSGFDVGLLVGLNVLLFAVSYLSFLRQDVRQRI